MHSLPDGYSEQTMTIEDVPRLTRFVNRLARRWIERDVISEDRLRLTVSVPGIDLAESARLIFAANDVLAAAGFVFHRDPHVTVHGWGLVDVPHQGLGIGRWLHDWILTRSRDALQMAPADARLVVRQTSFNGDAASDAFLVNAGYTRTRHYWRMLIELTEPPATPEWPDGIALDTFDPERDLRAIVRASRDAFQDHYGFVAGSFEQELERTRHRIEDDPGFDPSLQYLAEDGGEIAGLCFCSPNEAGDDTTGYVQSLGVRPAWRRRGIARALLLHAFGQFHQRGTRAVSLHVDAQSLTGATRLYESVGMRVDELTHEYELELRSGVDMTAKEPAN
jgi:mycothiol synthase